MSQFTHTQKAAALAIFTEPTCASQLTEAFNSTFGTNHSESDFGILLREWELSDVAKRMTIHSLSSTKPEPMYIPTSNRQGEMVFMLRKAIEIEASHRRAYWAQHS